MKLKAVTDIQTRRDFHQVPHNVYKNDQVWVCPLHKDIEAVFDPRKNICFTHGEAERWVLYDNNNKPAGRISAFIDRKHCHTYEQPTGGIGFFECVNDMQYAFSLFDQARSWLAERKMEAMDGPVNFGETDKYWGLLVDGFTHPSFDVPYNPPYYKQLFEEYGFLCYYNMEGFHIDIKTAYSERYDKIAKRIMNRPGYEFRHFTWKEKEKFAEDFVSVFNRAWATFKSDFEPIELNYIRNIINNARIIIDEEFIWYAYHNGNPIAVFVMFPDVNQIFKHLNGRLNLLSLAKFIYLKKRRTITRTKCLVMGVVPEFHNHGIESAFLYKLHEVLRGKPQYTEAELSWVADFNPRMRKVFVAVGGQPVKNYTTYRYLFDRSKEFRRHPEALYISNA